MQVTLAIKSDRLAGDDLQDLTREFCATVNRETEVSAHVPERPAEAGERGDPVTLGVLLLTFISSGAAVALFETVKALFERNSSVELDLKREDGRTLTIRAQNLGPDQIERTMAAAQDFFGAAA
jgi:hypothetical protein